jgi:hypothetical protein
MSSVGEPMVPSERRKLLEVVHQRLHHESLEAEIEALDLDVLEVEDGFEVMPDFRVG